MRVVADENIPGLEGLHRHGIDLRQLPGRAMTAADIEDADALLVRSVTQVDDALLNTALRLRFVGTATSGHEHVDRALLAARGIDFAHAPGSNANSVVEYVLGAIAETDDYLERLLAGGRVGIVGYGHIGQRLSRRLDALGIGWCASDPWLAGAPNAAPLDDVLTSEVVSLHPELTDAAPYPSVHLLHSGNLDRLPAQSLLINASRGAVIDNAALRTRLDAAAPPAVVLDVWENEPLLDCELLSRVRLGTAHIAGYSWDGKLLATRMLLAAMETALDIPTLPLISPAAPELEPDGGHAAGADFIRTLLASRYRVADDDRYLRDAMRDNSSPAARASAFDGLRRDYRCRRELAGSVVIKPQWCASQLEQARALGVEVRESGLA